MSSARIIVYYTNLFYIGKSYKSCCCECVEMLIKYMLHLFEPFYETIARFNMTWICNADYAVKHILFVV